MGSTEDRIVYIKRKLHYFNISGLKILFFHFKYNNKFFIHNQYFSLQKYIIIWKKIQQIDLFPVDFSAIIYQFIYTHSKGLINP
jgi:hypothetical protein